MSELYGHFIGVMIVVIMLTFIGIWIWAWLPHHKDEFSELARLPLDEDTAMSGFWSVWVMVLACVTVGVSLALFVWAHVDAHSHRGGWHHRPRVGARCAARSGSPAAMVVGGHFRRHFPVRRCLSIAVSGFRQFRRQARLDLAGPTAARHRRQQRITRGAPGVRCATLSIEQLAAHKEAVGIGHRLYLDNCAACHGTKALGNHAVGAPDLTDADWLYGGDGETILTSILDGRNGVMPPLGGALGHNGTNEVASYVVSVSGTQVPPDWVAAGKVRFDALCVACHGADGRGNPALGAPNLFDSAWLYGGNIESVVASVRDGRNGVMPAWRQRLSADEARLITAWVVAQGRRAAPQVAAK